MDFEKQTELLRKVIGRVVVLALIPFRAPGVLYHFFSETLISYEQRRAWERNVKGTWLDPETREPWWTSLGKVIPDPRRDH